MSITDAVAFADCNPPILADGLPGFGVTLFKPRNNQWRLGFELAVGHIVVREGAVKWILPRHEPGGDIVAPRGRIRIIKATIIRSPIGIPGTFVIRHRIVSASLFADPKYRGHDIAFPGITGCRARTRGGWDEDLRLHFKQCLLT